MRLEMLDEQKAARNKYMSDWYKKPENRQKKNAANREYRKKNWGRVRAWEKQSAQKARELHKLRNRKLKARYGIDIEQYDAMLKTQNGVCKICSSVNLDGKRLHVDHCHQTGKVRGLLCNGCNRKLGWYEILKTNIEKYLG